MIEKNLLTDSQRERIDYPNFEDKSVVQNWRNYIPTYFKNNWYLLTREARASAIIMSELMADSEEWD